MSSALSSHRVLDAGWHLGKRSQPLRHTGEADACPAGRSRPRSAVNSRACQGHGVGSLKSCKTMKEAYAVRRTVPPSAEIEERIDQLLAVGVGENPREFVVGAREAGCPIDHPAGCGGRVRRVAWQGALRAPAGGATWAAKRFRPRCVQTAEASSQWRSRRSGRRLSRSSRVPPVTNATRPSGFCRRARVR